MGLDLNDINEVSQADVPVVGGGYGNGLDIYATNASGASSVLTSQTATQAAPGGGTFGHPLMWWVVGAGLVVGLWFLFQRVGPPEERKNFANIELSFVNVLLLSLVPLVGIPVWKAVISNTPVPAGVKAFVLAA